MFGIPAMLCMAGGAIAQELDQYGGWTGLKGHNTSGYFRVEKINGRYWLVTPDNNVFWSIGHCVTQYNDTWGGRAPALGYYPNPYGNKAKYNGDYSAWKAAIKARNAAWGFNTIAAWGVQDFPETPECARAFGMTDRAKATGCRMADDRFADVFDPKFELACDDLAKSLAANATNKWTIGSFPDNEIHWANPDGYKTLPDAFIAFTPDAHGKQYWVNTFLKGKYATLAELNAAYGTSFTDWTGDGNTVINCTAIEDDPKYLARLNDKIDFMEAIADQYYRVTTTKMRRYDPNHLVFSSRWAMWRQGYASEYHRLFNERIWKKAGEYCDIFANNGYTDFGQTEEMYRHSSRVFTSAGKPFMITEHSYLANDSYFRESASWLATQMDRAICHQNHLKAVMDLGVSVDPNDGQPAKTCMGLHWFQYYDEPSLGRPDGEAGQFGLLNVKDEAFVPLVDVMATVHRQLYKYLTLGQPFVVPDAPRAFRQTSGTATPTFRWGAVPNAAGYTLLYSPERCFPEEQTIRVDGITGASYTPAVPLSPGTWYWTAKAVDAQGRGGRYLKTVQFKVGNIPDSQVDPALNLRCEQLTAWSVTDNSMTGGDGAVWAFRDTARKVEGESSARVVFTVNSLSKTTGRKNAGASSIPWKWVGPPMDYSKASTFGFKLYPQRFVDSSGSIISPSKYLRFKMVDANAGVVVDAPVDPDGALPRDAWSAVNIPLGGAARTHVSEIVFYINCGDEKLAWDQRMIFNIDEMTQGIAPK